MGPAAPYWDTLLVVTCAFACVAGALIQSAEAPDECIRCFAENRRLTDRIELLRMRVGQLEAELGTKSQRPGVCAAYEYRCSVIRLAQLRTSRMHRGCLLNSVRMAPRRCWRAVDARACRSDSTSPDKPQRTSQEATSQAA
jgi:hypothetical protein